MNCMTLLIGLNFVGRFLVTFHHSSHSSAENMSSISNSVEEVTADYDLFSGACSKVLDIVGGSLET